MTSLSPSAYYYSVRKFTRIFFSFLLSVVLISLCVTSAKSQEPTVSTPAPNLQGGQGGLEWTINAEEPGKTYIDGNTAFVDIQFRGLEPGDSKLWLFGKTKQEDRVFGKLDKVSAGSDGTLTVRVCGAGKDALKGPQVSSKKSCKTDGSDYFHEGNIYRLGLYDDENGLAQIMVAEFYVYHSAPFVKVEQVESGTLDKIRVYLSGRRYGGNDQNNYQVVLEGDKYKGELCFTTNKSDVKTVRIDTDSPVQTDFTNPQMSETNPANKTFTSASGQSGVPNGDYVLKVNEQLHEGELLRSGCQGGFTYVHIPLNISPSGIKIGQPEYDPNNSDGKNEAKLSFFSPAPCAKSDGTQCLTVRTAIGPVNVTPEGFVKSLFELLLMLAAFGGIIIIIYAGYILMTSRGDKEKLAAARETLTSAIVGLLFIILSIVILEIIGVDILQLPGFSR